MPAGPKPSARRRWRRLSRSRDPQSLRARFALLYDPKAPASLVARALPDLARSGLLPAQRSGVVSGTSRPFGSGRRRS